jgi:oxygen-independent coproporphyrinogen-3 oxidase
MTLGIYLSVPFCRTKCSYCNFASEVAGQGAFEGYVQRLCADVRRARETARALGAALPEQADSIYLGGGTPTLLEAGQMESIFAAVRETFAVAKASEITVECAPAALGDAMLATLVRCGVNRVSLGVQSFVDQETRAVGRRHTRAAALADIDRLRAAGLRAFNVDLIAGLPHQTRESWRESLGACIAAEAPHVSVYMLEIDEDSRLGRELIAGGTRYHAPFVPDEELTVELYEEAVQTLEAAGIAQYEISNFARAGQLSRHNLKYWTRQPYMGFGVDAHSFLPCPAGPAGNRDECEAVRFQTPETLAAYLASPPVPQATPVTRQQAREEEFFLGLRLNRGVELGAIAARYGLSDAARRVIATLADEGLAELDAATDRLRLTARGRLLSNEVFERFLGI